VREQDGKLQLDLTSAQGVTTPLTTYTFRVVSNENVATFIKELVLELEEGSPALEYQPGDYLQFDIPAYAGRTLHGFEVKPPYYATWQAQHVFDLKAENLAPCRRNYSMATHPATDTHLRFNIRIATPPPGASGYAGRGTAYLFGLRPGEAVTAIGPFGDFHVKETGREMVYLGGGSGMAPLRSHLSYLLETRKTTTRLSYWFGARSRQDLFYQEYFEALARQNENFSFHAALSEPRPEDGWQSHTGLIHEVLKREYLDVHPNPEGIDYFLCGPPAMIHAAEVMLKNLGVPPIQVAFDEF
jgi:Na(+)-translocating NADH:ubiquinone oxidoreductase F subunit